MSGLGQGNVSYKGIQVSGAPFTAGSAENGLSVDPVTGKIVLGQNFADPANPASLLSDRQIPTDGFYFGIGDTNFAGNGLLMDLIDSAGIFRVGTSAGGMINLNNVNQVWEIGDLNGFAGGNRIVMSSPGAGILNNHITLVCDGTLRLQSTAGILIETLSTLTNFAAAAVGTLNNAPVAGNPTKWIRIIDNGVNRHIPCW